MEQLPGNAFPQNPEGSFCDDFSNCTSDYVSYRIFRGAHLGACTLQQIGEQFSLGHADDAFVAQQGAGEIVDQLSCCHRIPPGEETLIQSPGTPVSDGGLELSKKKYKREELFESKKANSEENRSDLQAGYFVAIAPTRDSKILNPSVPPSSGSLERSGCGIIPSTFRPGLQMPAMLSSDPLGLASGVISPSGLE